MVRVPEGVGMRQSEVRDVRHRPKLEWSPPPATPPPRPRHAPSSRASPSFAQCQILYCSAIVIFYDTITQRVEITSAAKLIGLLHGTDQSTHKANNAIAFDFLDHNSLTTLCRAMLYIARTTLVFLLCN